MLLVQVGTTVSTFHEIFAIQEEEVLPNYEMLEDIGFGWYQIKHFLIVGLIIACDAGQVRRFNYTLQLTLACFQSND